MVRDWYAWEDWTSWLGSRLPIVIVRTVVLLMGWRGDEMVC